MARIPESEIERLKTEMSLERLAQARGVVLKRHGADLLGLCPFRDDREPSLVARYTPSGSFSICRFTMVSTLFPFSCSGCRPIAWSGV